MSQLHLNHANTSMLNTQLSFPRKYHWLALLPHLYPHRLEPPVNICGQDALYVLEGSILSLLNFLLSASCVSMPIFSLSGSSIVICAMAEKDKRALGIHDTFHLTLSFWSGHLWNIGKMSQTRSVCHRVLNDKKASHLTVKIELGSSHFKVLMNHWKIWLSMAFLVPTRCMTLVVNPSLLLIVIVPSLPLICFRSLW